MKLKIICIIGIALVLITCSGTEDPVEIKTLVKLVELPAAMQENSGMTEYQDLLWNINDSGNEPAIFGYNRQTNTIDRKIYIAGAVNTDWEEISQDEQHLYIGDFGNNAGSRHDLRIYIIDKSAVQSQSDTIQLAGVINFSYSNQTDFTPDNMNTQFDCEAFIAIGDSLVLFTKDWKTEQTALYTLPVTPGNFTARFRKRYDISGLVTAAAYSPGKNELLLLGYHFFVPFICVVPGFSLGDFSFSQKRRNDYNDFSGAQTEGIAYSRDGSIYVSCEQSPLGTSQSLFRAEI